MAMPASKAQQKAVSKYMKANYDEIKVRVPKGQKEAIQTHAATRGESVNGFINRVISEAIERESAEMNETTPET
ncbi:MAG: ABC transporter ATP-binding protein [Bacillota bacterium]|nr:ABC transporter ATP-binding protein [Bacillota bacterium]